MLLTRNMIKNIETGGNLSFTPFAEADVLESLSSNEIKKIGNNAYASIENDNIIIMSNEAISLPADCTDFFKGLNFKSIDLTNLDAENITSVVCMFEKLASQINFKYNVFENLKYTISMFEDYRCPNNAIDLSSCIFSILTHTSYMFCTTHTNSIILPDNFGENVTETDFMFWNACSKNVNLNKFVAKAITNAEGMFYRCELPCVDLSNCEFTKDCIIEDMFAYAHIDKLILKKSLADRLKANKTACLPNAAIGQVVVK